MHPTITTPFYLLEACHSLLPCLCLCPNPWSITAQLDPGEVQFYRSGAVGPQLTHTTYAAGLQSTRTDEQVQWCMLVHDKQHATDQVGGPTDESTAAGTHKEVELGHIKAAVGLHGTLKKCAPVGWKWTMSARPWHAKYKFHVKRASLPCCFGSILSTYIWTYLSSRLPTWEFSTMFLA